MMLDTVRRYLAGMASQKDARSVRAVVDPMADRSSSLALNSAGLAIKSGGSALAKIGATDFYACVKGVIVKIAASTDMPALTGLNITALKYNVICFFVDSAGTVTASMGTEGAALGNIVWPQFPLNQAMIGCLIITYASTFTGGSTPLDTATTVYINGNTGGFDPRVLIA